MKRFLSRFFAKIKKLNKKVIAGFLIGVIAGILLSYIFTSSYVVQLSIRNGIFLTKYNKWTGHVDWTLYNYEGDVIETSDSKKKKDLGLEYSDEYYYKPWIELSDSLEYIANSPGDRYKQLYNWTEVNDKRLKRMQGYTPEISNKLRKFALSEESKIYEDYFFKSIWIGLKSIWKSLVNKDEYITDGTAKEYLTEITRNVRKSYTSTLFPEYIKYYKSWSEYSNTDEYRAMSPDEQYNELRNWAFANEHRLKMAEGYTPELSRKLKEFALAKKREIFKDDLKYYKSWSEYSNTDEFKALSPDEQYQELYNWTAVTDRRMKMADGYTPELSRKLKEFAVAKKREIYKGKKED